MPSCNTYHLTWVSLTSSWLLQQSTAPAPYLGRGVSLTAVPPDLTGIAPLVTPALTQPLLLGGDQNHPQLEEMKQVKIVV